jgi:hypothetical protein
MGCDDVFCRAGRIRPGWQPFISSNRQSKESGPNGRGFNLLLEGATRLLDPASRITFSAFNHQLISRREYESAAADSISKLKTLSYSLTISAVSAGFDIRTSDLYCGFYSY